MAIIKPDEETHNTDPIGERRYGPGGAVYRIVATCAMTRNTHFAFEATEPPGGGPPLHIHTREDEFFMVLEGELTFWVDGTVLKRSVGDTAFVPRGTPHCFKNTSGQPVRVLIMLTPGDIETFFEYGAPLPDGAAPSEQLMMDRILSLAPAYGLEFLGPSPLV